MCPEEWPVTYLVLGGMLTISAQWFVALILDDREPRERLVIAAAPLALLVFSLSVIAAHQGFLKPQ